MLRIFAAGGTLGFPASEAVEAIVFCLGGIALTVRAERASLVRRFLVVYLLVVLVAWAYPSGLGHDVTRVRLLALPLVLLLAALRRWRPLPVVVAAVVLAGFWNIQPLASQWTASSADGSRAAAVWTAPVAWLHANLEMGYRVEAVDTSQHWPAYYLAGAGIPLARGWFRQDDFPFNRLLYGPSLDYGEYIAWLHRLGDCVCRRDAFPARPHRGRGGRDRHDHAASRVSHLRCLDLCGPARALDRERRRDGARAPSGERRDPRPARRRLPDRRSAGRRSSHLQTA